MAYPKALQKSMQCIRVLEQVYIIGKLLIAKCVVIVLIADKEAKYIKCIFDVGWRDNVLVCRGDLRASQKIGNRVQDRSTCLQELNARISWRIIHQAYVNILGEVLQ